MVRTYVRKTNRGNYPKETFEEAVEEIKAGRINAYQASKKYSIPYPKIKSHLKGRRGIKSKSFGRSTAIPIEYEKRLVEGLLKMEKYGFGLSRKEVQQLVGQFVNENKIKSPFINGVPGEDWFLGFAKRHTLMIGDVWSDLYPNIIINGFKKAGIHPLSRNVVPDSIYRATDLKRWNDAKMTEKDHYTQMAQDTNAVIGEDTLHPPIILERIAENSVDVDNFEEIHIKNSEIEETQYCTNREPDPSLVPKKLKTFEELLLDTIIANTSCA
ncbi:hypothetical protein HUJ05_010054 [Dendroctonus ponderosae]|nr:hypothetical protein HUJ05_010054 [Dendroctonus ponderosae]